MKYHLSVRFSIWNAIRLLFGARLIIESDGPVRALALNQEQPQLIPQLPCKEKPYCLMDDSFQAYEKQGLFKKRGGE